MLRQRRWASPIALVPDCVLPTAQLRDTPFHTGITHTLSKLVTLAGLRNGLSFCPLLLKGQDVFHQFY